MFWLCFAVVLVCFASGILMAVTTWPDAREALRIGLLLGALPAGAAVAIFMASAWFTAHGRFRAGRNSSRLGAVVAAAPMAAYPFDPDMLVVGVGLLVAGLLTWSMVLPLWESHVRTLLTFGDPAGLDRDTAQLMEALRKQSSI